MQSLRALRASSQVRAHRHVARKSVKACSVIGDPGFPVPSSKSMRDRFARLVLGVQKQVCAAVEEVDGNVFRQDVWTRPGGGGITCILQDGSVWEKAGVAVSVVQGTMSTQALGTALGKDIPPCDERVPYFVASVSGAMHPRNPHCPSAHFNYRYFETEDSEAAPGQWWFGGGADITPCYVVEEDMRHFHGVYKAVCERHGYSYQDMKEACDEYYTIAHRRETRGLGGIMYESLNNRNKNDIFDFSSDAAGHFVESYMPIVREHERDYFSPLQKEWQQIRRGRYIEYNLTCDRGITFGLQTGARVESVLMTMPLTGSWMYDYQVDPHSSEQKFLDTVRNAKAVSWV